MRYTYGLMVSPVIKYIPSRSLTVYRSSGYTSHSALLIKLTLINFKKTDFNGIFEINLIGCIHRLEEIAWPSVICSDSPCLKKYLKNHFFPQPSRLFSPISSCTVHITRSSAAHTINNSVQLFGTCYIPAHGQFLCYLCKLLFQTQFLSSHMLYPENADETLVIVY